MELSVCLAKITTNTSRLLKIEEKSTSCICEHWQQKTHIYLSILYLDSKINLYCNTQGMIIFPLQKFIGEECNLHLKSLFSTQSASDLLFLDLEQEAHFLLIHTKTIETFGQIWILTLFCSHRSVRSHQSVFVLSFLPITWKWSSN